MQLDIINKKTIVEFTQKHNIQSHCGWYRYSMSSQEKTLYSSCYAAMTLSLCAELDKFERSGQVQWADYLNSHQDDDGLYRDPVIYDKGWFKDDPLDCGRAHLTTHVITALKCLNSNAAKEIQFIDYWLDLDNLISWLNSRNWSEKIAWTGNEIMNIGVLLQYSRDFQNNQKAKRSVEILIDWLSSNYIDSKTGLWGKFDISNKQALSHAVQAAYHWWPLFFYDKIEIPYIEKAIDSLLLTQNPLGGFGWGVHNPLNPYLSSACEDIDSIDPLCRMMSLTAYRNSDICEVLNKAAQWVISNKTIDGGFTFIKDAAFEYGHPEMSSIAGQGAMFPTWFRLLSLGSISQSLFNFKIGDFKCIYVNCPGFHFW